ncbi:hypothetical protein [Streptomyces canus]|uniref:hypothetical protein n=1 Tax=Streptomyces canus TaxID=58343 RepID=UPI002E2C2B55|nr:hypothetical protein [Streptomyces canus]
MTDGENGAAPTRVSWVGLWAAIVAYLFLLALGLQGPVLMVLGAFAGQALVISGIVCTADFFRGKWPASVLKRTDRDADLG